MSRCHQCICLCLPEWLHWQVLWSGCWCLQRVHTKLSSLFQWRCMCWWTWKNLSLQVSMNSVVQLLKLMHIDLLIFQGSTDTMCAIWTQNYLVLNLVVKNIVILNYSLLNIGLLYLKSYLLVLFRIICGNVLHKVTLKYLKLLCYCYVCTSAFQTQRENELAFKFKWQVIYMLCVFRHMQNNVLRSIIIILQLLDFCLKACNFIPYILVIRF